MKILVVDDHVLIRQAMHGVLKKLKRDASVLDASNSAEALNIVSHNPDIDLVLLDLSLPDRDGFSVLAELRKRLPQIAIVVLSAVQDRDNVVKALDLGALGFIPKSAQSDVILNALRLVLGGGIYVPPEILAREEIPLAIPRAERGTSQVTPADLGLTERQLDVLALIMQGKNNKTICRILDLAEPTVKNHVTAILRALKVENRTEAVVAANRMHWDLPAPSGS